MVRALIEGKIADPRQAKDIIDTCILCGECTSVCFSEVPTANLMVQARHLINKKAGVPMGLSFVLRMILPHPRVMRWALRLSFLGKTLGFAWLASKSGLLKKLAPPLFYANNILKRAPLRFATNYKQAKLHSEEGLEQKKHQVLVANKKLNDYKVNGKKPPEDLVKKSKAYPHRPRATYFLACGSQYLKPKVGVASFELLEKLNIDFMISNFSCCGLPGASAGVLESVQAMAKKNIEEIEQGNYDKVLVDDTSCAAHLRELPLYFQEDAEWLPRAEAIANRVQNLTSYLLSQGLTRELKQKKWTKGPVAFHDPCKAQYAQHMTQPPRELLKSIQGLKLVDIPDSDQCCGGGGTYGFSHPDLSQEILKAKTRNIVGSGAKTIVTTSTSCSMQVEFGLRKEGSKIPVYHLHEFLLMVLNGN